MRQVKDNRPERIASRARVRTRQAWRGPERASRIVSLGFHDGSPLGYGLRRRYARRNVFAAHKRAVVLTEFSHQRGSGFGNVPDRAVDHTSALD